ncbi:MAG TPA: hypothetical protein VIZ29_05400 [Gaiellaceae bacterium]
MRPRRIVLLVLALAVVVALLRRREPAEYVEVDFDDGSSIRFGRGAEARDLLADADELVGIVA